MTATYLEAPGQRIAPGSVRVPKAQQVRDVLLPGTLPYVRFVECRRNQKSAADIVVFEVDVEVPQRPTHDIRPTERIAVSFSTDDTWPPETLALREDFPLVPHLNLRDQELPRSLCLYDEPYSEVRLRWTAREFVERIREWLRRTALGKLHDADQPLEPLLLVGTPLVLPARFFVGDFPTSWDPILIRMGDYAFIADDHPMAGNHGPGLVCVATVVQGIPQPHGIIRARPQTIRQLHEFLLPAKIDLLDELRMRLRGWHRSSALLEAHLVIIASLPKSRVPGGSPEGHDTWAFLCTLPIREIGAAIGTWRQPPKPRDDPRIKSFLILEEDRTKQGDDVDITTMKPVSALTRELAGQLSGVTTDTRPHITAVGLGALGSQVFSNLARMGFGEWITIDSDIVLPHNLVRNALDHAALGKAKAAAIAAQANAMIDGEPIAAGIAADILHPGQSHEEIAASLADADLVLDMSASVAVARHLARSVDAHARRASFFLSPTGEDSVLLAEDAARVTRLDHLEMQYYRALLDTPALRGHLRRDDDRVRYANSCRDLSSVIPQDLAAIHAAIGGRAVRDLFHRDDASITIWRTDEAGLAVSRLMIDVAGIVELERDGWRLCTDRELINRVVAARAAKLPNETGGVLIGTFDSERKIVYVVDTVLSPPDSTEWPTVYIRGCQGLTDRITEIATVTGGMLSYVGEWHSHPRGHGCAPSGDDRRAFAWLRAELGPGGLPPLMLIVGEGEQFGWYLGTMSV